MSYRRAVNLGSEAVKEGMGGVIWSAENPATGTSLALPALRGEILLPGEAVRILLNEAMRLERSQVLEAEPYERNEKRRGYANGFKLKTVGTRFWG